jgi:hypothetical protein
MLQAGREKKPPILNGKTTAENQLRRASGLKKIADRQG